MFTSLAKNLGNLVRPRVVPRRVKIYAEVFLGRARGQSFLATSILGFPPGTRVTRVEVSHEARVEPLLGGTKALIQGSLDFDAICARPDGVLVLAHGNLPFSLLVEFPGLPVEGDVRADLRLFSEPLPGIPSRKPAELALGFLLEAEVTITRRAVLDLLLPA